MAWHLLEKVVETSASHATLLGKWWIAILFVFRIIVVASIGDNVYSDEQDSFVCNTKQPGCKQACYDDFAPISHIRFWAFQIIATGTPSILFIVMALHTLGVIAPETTRNEAAKDVGTQTSQKQLSLSSYTINQNYQEEKRGGSTKSSQTHFGKMFISSQDQRTEYSGGTAPPGYNKICREEKVKRAKSKILKVYVLTLVCRTLIEGGCLVAQFMLYGWSVPRTYKCSDYPCIYYVECYPSRPTEKTIFLYFMFGVGVICCLINVLEIVFLIWKRLKREINADKSVGSENSFILGTYPIMDIAKIHNLRHGEQRANLEQKAKREIGSAPPGYYIPDVEPPSEKYHSPANGFPPIRLRAASFTTSESDVTDDEDENSLIVPLHNLLEENARIHL